MRAALCTEQGHPVQVVDDIELDEPGAGEVVVRVAYCGVCHSDLSLLDGAVPGFLPLVLGHEAAGVVEALGPGVRDLAVGDHVVLAPSPSCGRCYFCVRGEWSICVDASGVALGTLPDGGTRLSRGGAPVYRGVGIGALAERVVVPEGGAVRIDPDVPLDVVCTLGCAVQTGVGAVVNTAQVEAGATVLVMGLGGVGLSIVQGARLVGASQIIVSDPVAARREAALGFGATLTLDPTTDDLVAAVLDATGVGADYAFDAAGRSALVQTGVNATRPGGTTVLVGVPPFGEPLTIDLATVFAVAEKKLLGCFLGGTNPQRDLPRLVSLWQTGRLDLEGLITHRRPLADVGAAFDDLRAGTGIRTVIEI
jgi:2-desacetyl-2-hydroxyethyl bacteriochlorophyllide A dehydrogenase